MSEFKVGDKVVCICCGNHLGIKVGDVYTVAACWQMGLESVVRLHEAEPEFIYAHRFKLVEEKPKPASFKDFLSPMCRVELGNGSRWVYVGGEFITKGDWHGSEYQYYADGKLRGMWESCTSQGYEIVKVFDKPKSPAQYLDINAVGELLWECPELAAVRKVKEQKVAEIQKEIKEWEAKRESSLLQANSAASIISDLEKQLKEIE